MEPRISIITLGVSDMQRAYRFYHEGLGFPTAQDAEAPIIFFHTAGTRLALYPLPALAEDISDQLPPGRGEFPGLTLAHNTRTQAEVDEILRRAEEAGGKIEKPAQPTSWGGYSGYFSDPDGYLWEVAYADAWTFNPDGSLALEGLSSAREAWYIVNVEAVVHRKDRYLMVVRGAGESHAPGLLSLVGGKVEAAGDAQQILEATLRREIREETGIEVCSRIHATLGARNLPVYLYGTAGDADIASADEQEVKGFFASDVLSEADCKRILAELGKTCATSPA